VPGPEAWKWSSYRATAGIHSAGRSPYLHLRPSPLVIFYQSRSVFLLSNIGLYLVDAPVRRSAVALA
jgi:hypothetical protein